MALHSVPPELVGLQVILLLSPVTLTGIDRDCYALLVVAFCVSK